jgi:choline kinase
MTRFITNITKTPRRKARDKRGITVAILSAGTGSRIKSYEPRSLLKIGNDLLVEHQISTIKDCFDSPEIINVVGCHANKVIKKTKGKTRIVENQLHDSSNSSESLRLAFNNTMNENILFMHGDLYFNKHTLDVDYDKSFVILDTKNQIKETEVGVTVTDDKLSIMSYGLSIKWAQIAYFTGKEYKILKAIFQKYENQDKKKLSFEIINMVLAAGGHFVCHEPEKMSITEIDRIKDIV